MKLISKEMLSRALTLIPLLLACGQPAGETPAAAAPPSHSLAASEKFRKAEGAHFEVNLDLWEVAAELKDENENIYYLTFTFLRSGPAYMQYRYAYAGIYDVKNRKYLHETHAPEILATAAMKELLARAQRHPGDKSPAEAAERIRNKQYRNFTPLIQPPAVYRNELFIHHDTLHFKRISKDTFLYSLHVPIESKTVSLKMESFTDPVIYDSKRSIPAGTNSIIQGYAFPRVFLEGTISDADKKTPVRGRGWHYHLIGSPEWKDFTQYTIISQNLTEGDAFQTFAFYDTQGKPASTTLRFREGEMGESFSVKSPRVEPEKEWRSAASTLTYPGEWQIKSETVSGAVRILHPETEPSLIEGRGAFFIGPCAFTGEVSRKTENDDTSTKTARKTAGTGFCRIVSRETD